MQTKASCEQEDYQATSTSTSSSSNNNSNSAAATHPGRLLLDVKLGGGQQVDQRGHNAGIHHRLWRVQATQGEGESRACRNQSSAAVLPCL